MADRSIDRRIERTRGMLHHALISLILKKGYDTITITDICDEANIGRSTFYAHYVSKDDLKRKGLEEHLRRMLSHGHGEMDKKSAKGGDSYFAFSMPMFAHARSHLDLYRALLGSAGSSIALTSIREIVSERVRLELASPRKTMSDMPREVTVQYVVGAFMSLLAWWLDGGAKLNPEKMDGMFQRLAAGGVWSGR